MPNDNNVWKACNRHKRFPSSNLGHSAKKANVCGDWRHINQRGEMLPKAAFGGKKTENKPMRRVHVTLYCRTKTGIGGTSPLLLAVNLASTSAYIPIHGIRLKPSQWDKVRKRVINHPHAATINSAATSTLGRANDAVIHIMQNGGVRGMSVRQVRDKIAEYLYPPGEDSTPFLNVLEFYAERCNRPNTRDKYKQTATHLRRWLGGEADRLSFSDVTPEWLRCFDLYLVGSCPSVNSRGIHLRNIRTVFNFAITQELTTARYPFRAFKIRTAPAQPRALTLEQLRTLWHYTPPTDAQRYWLDVWRVIFTLIGINMADLFGLQRIAQGRVNYTRQKTGRLYSVKVENEARTIIAMHRGQHALLDLSERCTSVHTATSTANKHLKTIAAALGLPPVTTYTARYTWASVAMSLDIPIEVISQALGHSYGQAVTLGYIMPDRRKVDAANRKVLDAL